MYNLIFTLFFRYGKVIPELTELYHKARESKKMNLTDREDKVLRQFFDTMILENGKTVTEELQDIHNLPYVKNFKPAPGQTRLTKSEFEDFADKILELVSPKQKTLDDTWVDLLPGSKVLVPTVNGTREMTTKNRVCIYLEDEVLVEDSDASQADQG